MISALFALLFGILLVLTVVLAFARIWYGGEQLTAEDYDDDFKVGGTG